jgi:hypothetical protein
MDKKNKVREEVFEYLEKCLKKKGIYYTEQGLNQYLDLIEKTIDVTIEHLRKRGLLKEG